MSEAKPNRGGTAKCRLAERCEMVLLTKAPPLKHMPSVERQSELRLSFCSGVESYSIEL